MFVGLAKNLVGNGTASTVLPTFIDHITSLHMQQVL